MRKVLLFCVFTFLCVGLFGITASAQEVEQGTQFARDFEQNIVPLIMSAAGAIGGVLVAFGLVVSAIRKVKKAFQFAKSSMDEAKDTAKTKAGENERLNAVIAEQNEKILQMAGNQEKLMEICKIAFLNNPELVKSGYAMDIAKVVDDEERKEAVEAQD